MEQTGHPSLYEARRHGLTGLRAAHWNHEAPALYEMALARKEGVIAREGPLVVRTGQHTGRSAQDKFILRDSVTEGAIWWEHNAPISPENFARLREDMLAYARGREIFIQDLYAGAAADHRLRTRVYAEYAWHALFIRNLLIEPPAGEPGAAAPDLTILVLPGFQASPERHGVRGTTVIALDLEQGLVLIGGTSYAGEIKKSVFTVLNYRLPPRGVMPMHCSVNVGTGRSGRPAIFFGLSGTGKTTLSADPSRRLVGDDEHGWGPEGLFNFEGGCYAKMIRLSQEDEPQIFAAARRFGTVLENVGLDPQTRALDLDDASLTENTRGAYPLSFIPGVVEEGRAGAPATIVMLAADAFGVLPPIARLTPGQAMYHFLSGYTAKIAGTEKGVTEPQATFSACFGAPFMPRHPAVYGRLLRDLIARHAVRCWLVNTGWTGGGYGTGSRIPISATRALVAAALSGLLDDVPMRVDPHFGVEVPCQVDGVNSVLLTPRACWPDPAAYDAQAARLLQMFARNFRQFEDHVDADVIAAAPRLAQAAE